MASGTPVDYKSRIIDLALLRAMLCLLDVVEELAANQPHSESVTKTIQQAKDAANRVMDAFQENING